VIFCWREPSEGRDRPGVHPACPKLISSTFKWVYPR
jgi:hypothetical protein